MRRVPFLKNSFASCTLNCAIRIHERLAMSIALIAHGGAGNWRPGSEEDAIEGMRAAVAGGRSVLHGGGSALDAVCATVVALEDNPIFHAGTRAVLKFDRFSELDASVMGSHEPR